MKRNCTSLYTKRPLFGYLTLLYFILFLRFPWLWAAVGLTQGKSWAKGKTCGADKRAQVAHRQKGKQGRGAKARASAKARVGLGQLNTEGSEGTQNKNKCNRGGPLLINLINYFLLKTSYPGLFVLCFLIKFKG